MRLSSAVLLVLAFKSVCAGGDKSLDLTLSLGDELDLADFPGAIITAAYEIDITPEDVEKAQTITLPNGDVFTYDGDCNHDGDYDSYAFVGDDDAEAELTVNLHSGGDHGVNGMLKDSEGQAYELSHQGGDDHVWFVVDMVEVERLANIKEPLEDNLPPSSRMLSPQITQSMLSRGITQSALDAALAKGKSDSSTMAQLSVKFYFTKEYEAKTTDVRGKLETIVAGMNQAFKNTNIKINVNLHCIERYIGPQGASMGDTWNEFKVYKATQERLHGSADLTGLISTDSGYCGLGSFKTTNFPISISEKWCAEADYTFEHEFGHNLGAHHDPGTAGSGYEYGYGYLLGTTKKRSVMAYNSDSKHGTQTNWFSDDTLSDNSNDKLGSATEDNSRMIQERRFMYELIGDESQACKANFEPDMTEGIVGYSAWQNYGCATNNAEPMTREIKCLTKYFPCSNLPANKTESKTCKCPDSDTYCQHWKNSGYCTHSYVAWMSSNCAFSCDTCP